MNKCQVFEYFFVDNIFTLWQILQGTPYNLIFNTEIIHQYIQSITTVRLSSTKFEPMLCRHILNSKSAPCLADMVRWLLAWFVDMDVFFNCYLAATTLGHSQGYSLANPMLITAFMEFDLKVTRRLITRLGH